ncbi:phosphomevalonate kinase [Tuanshanicoccus lijuaniae]|uniref:phosphomevalonate kinase n=1 Tax=Aerococcaceae bacterium zg-1292 TaxID=2774330 RepID=UPI001BD873B7|nr:phosphomevalonate kinase [Aerococcaceae bacterium zg-A91]MBS4458497.1 phosphomevalonate kinase [Aerococcaceae bacterium zg-BR33]
MKQTTIRIPGKLYIAGEYAVLEPGEPAIIVAVDAYLSCRLEEKTHTGYSQWTSSLYPNDTFYYQGQHQVIPKKWHYVYQAVTVAETYLSEIGIEVTEYDLHFDSELIDQNGAKYGLGSSGAVTVATIKAILTHHQYAFTPVELYKLATLASLNVSEKGSFGDIAACVSGGWVLYRSFDRQWLLSNMQARNSYAALVQQPWPLLEISPLDVHPTLQLMIGWTQSPASTDYHVQHFEQARLAQDDDYQYFIHESRAFVETLATALIQGDLTVVFSTIQELRHLLQKISAKWQLGIETPALTQLIEDAAAYQYEAKTSGAGGGDCGIALGHNTSEATALTQLWQQHHINPLQLSVAPSQTR